MLIFRGVKRIGANDGFSSEADTSEVGKRNFLLIWFLNVLKVLLSRV